MRAWWRREAVARTRGVDYVTFCRCRALLAAARCHGEDISPQNFTTRRLLRKDAREAASLKPRKAAVVRNRSADLQRETSRESSYSLSQQEPMRPSEKARRRELLKLEFSESSNMRSNVELEHFAF